MKKILLILLLGLISVNAKNYSRVEIHKKQKALE